MSNEQSDQRIRDEIDSAKNDEDAIRRLADLYNEEN